MSDLLDLLNAERRRHRLAPYTSDARLMAAASAHAAYMLRSGRLTHVGADRSQPWDRIARAGYVWRYCGENVASGARAESAVLSLWLSSPAHRDAILSPHYTQVGCSRAGDYWCVVFASPIRQ